MAGSPTYSSSPISTPTSSATSRRTAASADSPGSTNPARVEKLAGPPMRAMAEQNPVGVVGDRHDHRHVGARVVLAAVHRAAARPAGLAARVAAHRTARTCGAVVPRGQRHRRRGQVDIAVAEQMPDVAQRRPGASANAGTASAACPLRSAGSASIRARIRAVVVLAEEQPAAPRPRPLGRRPSSATSAGGLRRGRPGRLDRSSGSATRLVATQSPAHQQHPGAVRRPRLGQHRTAHAGALPVDAARASGRSSTRQPYGAATRPRGPFVGHAPADAAPATGAGAYGWRVARSPLALAALATDAIPGLDVHDVRLPAHATSDTDAAVVIDATGTRWVVRAPQNAAAGAALEAEVALLDSLIFYVDAGRLPFDVPRPEGFTPLPEGGRAVVHRQIPGRSLRLERLGPGPGLAAAVGRAIAALHELPVSTVEDTGLPVYTADEYRRRRLAEVDEAAKTGLVPTAPAAQVGARPGGRRDLAVPPTWCTATCPPSTCSAPPPRRRRSSAGRRPRSPTPPTTSHGCWWPHRTRPSTPSSRRTTCAGPSCATLTWPTGHCSPASWRSPVGCCTVCGWRTKRSSKTRPPCWPSSPNRQPRPATPSRRW